MSVHERTDVEHERASRIQVLNKMIGKEVPVADAAGLMGVSERHAWRLLAAYREEGAAAIAHGNRGQATVRPPRLQRFRSWVLALAQGRYAGFNHSHLSEMLAGREASTSRAPPSGESCWRVGSAVPAPARAHALPAQGTLPQEGMLLQIDGAVTTGWRGRGPRLTLIGAVDDATGMVPFALFREQEDAQGYMLMLKEVIERCGVPLALYSDRHSIFQRSPLETESRDEQLRGRREPTQFARALAELGIELILAHTPQAKGRVERAWDTFQDRLVSEMRLAGTATIEEANRMLWDFLPRYDQQFGVAPVQQASAYRQLPPDVSLEAVLCFKYLRTVAHDNTIRFNGAALQLLPMASGPATPGPAWKSRNGWTAASWSSTGAEPWPRSRPPPNRSCSGPAAVGVPTANPQSTRTPSWTTSDTAHRRLLPALRRRPRLVSPPSQHSPIPGGERY